jgi:hypothetical protein
MKPAAPPAAERALLLARKSNKVKLSDAKYGDGLSLETQDEVTGAFADARDWKIVDAAGDTVSGRKITPFERKNLGPWLTDPALIAQWDVLVAATGDRISRERIEHWAELEAWIVRHGKKLVICERGGVYFPPRHEGDSYNWTGVKSGAGNEWESIRTRIVRSQCHILRNGGWCGRAPFGYTIVGAKYAKRLKITPELRKIVVKIFDMTIAGKSLRQVSGYLEAEGIPTTRGNARWSETTLKQLIENDVYSGSYAHGCAECGEKHVLEVPAILEDMATQKRAQAALKSRRFGDNGGGKPTKNPAMLVPMCPDCGIKMFRSTSGATRGNVAYYTCKRRTIAGERVGCGTAVRCDLTDEAVNAILSAEREDETTVTTTYPAAELESEIELVRRAERDAFEADDVDAQTALRAQRNALKVKLDGAVRELVTAVATGRTIGQVWRELEPSERRAWLKLRRVTVQLSKDVVTVHLPGSTQTVIGRTMLLG